MYAMYTTHKSKQVCESKRNDTYNERTTGSSREVEVFSFLELEDCCRVAWPVARSVTVAVWLPSSSLLARGTARRVGEVGLWAGSCWAERLLALDRQSVSVWLRRAMESGLMGAPLLVQGRG